jgi:ubiquinone/menaquinone biosynthesis C-methylase UbiE
MEPEKAVEEVLERGEVDLYGSDAELYDLIFASETSLQNKEHSVRRNVPEGSRVLELGSGTGAVTERIDQDYEVYASDAAREMLEVAEEKDLDAELVQADMRSLPYRGEFDAVVMYGHPISHLEEFSEVFGTLESIHGALKEDGVLVMDYLNEGVGDVASMGWTEKEIGGYTVRMKPEFSNYKPATHSVDSTIRFEVDAEDRTHVMEHGSTLQGFSHEKIKHLLKEAGFDTVEEQRIFSGGIHSGVRAEKGEPERKTSLGFDL